MSWLLQKPADLDLHCLQKQGLSGFSRTRVNQTSSALIKFYYWLIGFMLKQFSKPLQLLLSQQTELYLSMLSYICIIYHKFINSMERKYVKVCNYMHSSLH